MDAEKTLKKVKKILTLPDLNSLDCCDLISRLLGLTPKQVRNGPHDTWEEYYQHLVDEVPANEAYRKYIQEIFASL